MDDGDTERLAGLLDALAVTLRAAGKHRFTLGADGHKPHDRADPSHELVADIDQRQQLLDFLAGGDPDRTVTGCVPRWA